MLQDDVRAIFAATAEAQRQFVARHADALARVIDVTVAALRDGHTLFFFGNGGSAADAIHLAAELVVRLRTERPGLPALALTTNPSVLTAAGNDYGLDRIFSRQIESLVTSQDVLVALSTSGTSTNIVRGVEAGRIRKAYLVAFTGETGGAPMHCRPSWLR